MMAMFICLIFVAYGVFIVNAAPLPEMYAPDEKFAAHDADGPSVSFTGVAVRRSSFEC